MRRPNGIKAKKHLSQNFLTDQNIVRKIIHSVDLKKDDRVLEIGPGYGAMTFPIIEILGSIDVIELDHDLVNFLNEKNTNNAMNIIQADALSYDFTSLRKEKPMRLIGNLPYHISTPLMFHLLQFSSLFQDFHVMVQKEVADRIVSGHNNKIYGRLSVAIQARCEASKVFDVKPNAFNPRPKVNSSIIRLVPKTKMDPKIDQNLTKVIKLAFNQRRKKILNSLKEIFTVEQLLNKGVDPNARAENLSIEDYLRLSNLEKEKTK